MNNIESFDQFNEARVINPHYNKIRSEEPLADDEVIRVYHGFGGERDAFSTCKYGLTGRVRAKRTYSYEAGNNPKGLFVTVDMNVAKQFTNCGIIMEFHAKMSDLEAPVWSGGGSYFVQGDYTTSFKDNDEREEQRMKSRERASNDRNAQVAQSDRPELADTLFNNAEKQALYIGDLNPNMIRAFWVNERLLKDRRIGGDYTRITRSDFEKLYVAPNVGKYMKDRMGNSDIIDKSFRPFKPNDNFDMAVIIDKWGEEADVYLQGLLDRMAKGDHYAEEEVHRFLYPKQIQQALGR